ncbi:hypothetical protein EV182_005730, partial [Spiromyces aspiralis]
MRELYEDYKRELSELTFNSGPKIFSLTSIAKENMTSARAVTAALVEHIRSASTQCKLPAVYLLDSICKNVGCEYLRQLEPQIHS